MVFQATADEQPAVDPEGAWRGSNFARTFGSRARTGLLARVMRNSNVSFHLAQARRSTRACRCGPRSGAHPAERRARHARLADTRGLQDAIDKPHRQGVRRPRAAGTAYACSHVQREKRRLRAPRRSKRSRPPRTPPGRVISKSRWPTTCARCSIGPTSRPHCATCCGAYSSTDGAAGISTEARTSSADDGRSGSTCAYFLRCVLARRWLADRGRHSPWTAVPAAICGIRDRGLLQVGTFGDMMLFDPERIDIGERSLGVDRSPDRTRSTAHR